uniref:Uncharacterized protein n=1 Tax=Arundo donax TaxID=35708 RepID=A0A0A8ZFV3_ARUDO
MWNFLHLALAYLTYILLELNSHLIKMDIIVLMTRF